MTVYVDRQERSALWNHIYGSERGVLALFSGARSPTNLNKLGDPCTAYFTWPEEETRAHAWMDRQAAAGRETYHCGHLLRSRRRTKEHAAPIKAAYVDGDGAEAPDHLPPPSATVESSPGRAQSYWCLSCAVAPEVGEALNRRLALAMGADRSGWDLTQLLRSPGTPNHKYLEAPIVRLVELTDTRYKPDELDRLLPPLAPERQELPRRALRPVEASPAPDLYRLSPRMRDLILYGNCGEFRSRSEADMAACVALFGASYTEVEVWLVMTDPANGISQKTLEKGRHGERYLELTIGKARAIVTAASPLRRGKVYGHRREVVSLV